jgi:uncharacterized protein
MNPLNIIKKFYTPASECYHILMEHSQSVMDKALNIASRVHHLNPDLQFIEEASMLHDIGIFKTHAPKIQCLGDHPYICHGFLGRELLEALGYKKHALVCERHIGTGLTLEEIKSQNLPIPEREYLPLSIEEKIICFADKFFSKNPDQIDNELSLDEVVKEISGYGNSSLKRFNAMCELFI